MLQSPGALRLQSSSVAMGLLRSNLTFDLWTFLFTLIRSHKYFFFFYGKKLGRRRMINEDVRNKKGREMCKKEKNKEKKDRRETRSLKRAKKNKNKNENKKSFCFCFC